MEIPEIRVWCHPVKGDDYYRTFDCFTNAFSFIESNRELAELVPLIFFRGREYNIFLE